MSEFNFNLEQMSADDNRAAMLFAALETTGNGLVITDPRRADNPIVYVNQTFVDRCGFTRPQILGRNCRFLQQGDRDQSALVDIRTALRDEKSIDASVRNYRSDGSMFKSRLSIAPTHDSNGRLIGFVGVQYEETAFELSRRRLKEFYSTISHELRTPLSTLSSALEIISEGSSGKFNAEQKKLLRVATQNCSDFSSMMLKILEQQDSYANTSHVSLEIIEADEAIQRLLSEFLLIAEYRQITLSYRPNRTVFVLADKAKLTRILTTLASLVLRHSVSGGVVTLGFEQVSAHRVRFFVKDECGAFGSDTAVDFDDWALMQISSNLPPDGNVYDLAICRTLVELQGGEMGRLVVPGQSKTYWFELNSSSVDGVGD